MKHNSLLKNKILLRIVMIVVYSMHNTFYIDYYYFVKNERKRFRTNCSNRIRKRIFYYIIVIAFFFRIVVGKSIAPDYNSFFYRLDIFGRDSLATQRIHALLCCNLQQCTPILACRN